MMNEKEDAEIIDDEKKTPPPPPLPPKLPPEQRKKLSLTACVSETKSDSAGSEKLPICQLPTVVMNESTIVVADEIISGMTANNDGYLSLDALIIDDSLEMDTAAIKHDVVDVPSPPIPPKRKKSLKKMSFRAESFDPRSFALENFKSELFKNVANKICADCKSSQSQPNWISCLYFILLCDDCAEVHMKLSHTINRYYLIEIEHLFDDLSNETFFVDIDTFLSMFALAGNEKINSLLEYTLKESDYQNRETFVRDKYINRRFINKNEIDYTGNYVDELNRLLFDSVASSPSLTMTIYFIFLGANLNARIAGTSILENSKEYKTIYLFFQYPDLDLDANSLEFIGEVQLITDIRSLNPRRSQIYLKLTHTGELLLIYPNNQLKSIPFDTIIRVFDFPFHPQIIEVKWFDHSNSSIVSTYLEMYTFGERQLWMRRLLGKLTPLAGLGGVDLIDQCIIDAFGVLNVQDSASSSPKRTWVLLVKSLDAQVEKFFRKCIVLVEAVSNRVEIIDVRKLVRIKLDLQNHSITIDTTSTTTRKVVQSVNGYSENLRIWFDKLDEFRQLKFRSIEEQYINKDNCPLIIDKLCSFVEIYFLTEKSFYASTSYLNEIKKFKTIFSRLESERDFNLDLRIVNNAGVILGLFKLYFAKYLRYNQDEISGTIIKSIKDFKILDDKSSLLYHILKRVSIHLTLIAKYESFNQHTLLELVMLFESLILGRLQTGFSLNLDRYAVNCITLFGLPDAFFHHQFQMIEKLLSLKQQQQQQLQPSGVSPLKTRFKFSNYLVRVFAQHNDPSSASFQFIIDTKAKAKTSDVLRRAKHEFTLENANLGKYGLFECGDGEVLLERVLSVNSVLINSLSNWRAFILVVKPVYFDEFNRDEEGLSFFDSCHSLGVCQKCFSRKWQANYISVQNANLKLFSKLKTDSDFEELNLEHSKLVFEARIEECLVYYGMCEFITAVNNGDLSASSTTPTSTSPLSQRLRQVKEVATAAATATYNLIQLEQFEAVRENCLTLYHLKSDCIYSMCFATKQKALQRYSCLFKLANSFDNWSLNSIVQ